MITTLVGTALAHPAGDTVQGERDITCTLTSYSSELHSLGLFQTHLLACNYAATLYWLTATLPEKQ